MVFFDNYFSFTIAVCYSSTIVSYFGRTSYFTSVVLFSTHLVTCFALAILLTCILRGALYTSVGHKCCIVNELGYTTGNSSLYILTLAV